MPRCTRPLRTLLVTAAAAAAIAGPAEPATITVNTAADADAADGFCSLREAILAANDDLPRNECPAGNGEDRIVFDLTTPAVIDLTADLPLITETLMIQGPGGPLLAIDGNDLHRMLHFDTIANDGWFGVERLTLYRGRSPGGASGDGGGAYIDVGETAYFYRVRFLENHSANSAGGLGVGSATGALETTATVVECLFGGNVAEGPSGGGGLAMIGTDGEVRVVRSTFVGNEAAHENGSGGGLAGFRGLLALESSTVSGNTANADGGGILFLVTGSPPLSGTLSLRDTTVTANVANLDNDLAGEGGGIQFQVGSSFTADLELVNSVVAGNFDTGVNTRLDLHCSGDVALITGGSGFIGSNASCETIYPAGSPNAGGDWVGTAAAPLDPGLLPLADNGGPLPTHAPDSTPPRLGALLAFSLLIDSGNCSAAITDQRGFGNAATAMRLRNHPDVPDAPGSDGCDIGAVEVGTVRIDRTIFADGFESGNTLLWSDELLSPSPARSAGG